MLRQQAFELSEPLGEHDHIRGRASAEVTLVEYGNFEAPYCRMVEPIVAGLLKALDTHMKVAFRHFPMQNVHPNSWSAAEVVEAAGAQGKFWEMYEKLFANQKALEPASLVLYANELSLDSDRIEGELRNHLYLERVKADRTSGIASHVNGTPTFYIDGWRYNGPIALKEMLAAIRDQHPDL